jgi:predicted RNA-binding Zn ribbon-like protein
MSNSGLEVRPGTTLWPGDDESKPAPEPLLSVQSLVNTVERPDGDDRLVDPADARAWLEGNRLLAPGAALTSEDLLAVRDVREAIRAMLVHNAGGPAPSTQQLSPLREVAADRAVRAGIADGGEVVLSAAGSSVRDGLLAVLLIVRDAQRDGTWARLKACGNDECLWAFYDRSRNHGGAWCDMATCGNKLKNRDFRARRKAST